MNKGKDLSFLRQELIAHRGVYDNKNFNPENSIKAFKNAIENSCIRVYNIKNLLRREFDSQKT